MFTVNPSTGSTKWAKALPAQNRFQMGVMSHPYAFTVAPDGSGYAIAGHGYRCTPPVISANVDWDYGCEPQGLIVKVSVVGDLERDSWFKQEGAHLNVECYGISPAADGGFVVTCGYGSMYKDDPAQDLIWRTLTHRTSSDGQRLWQKLYTSNDEYENNTGEYVLTTSNSEYMLILDAQYWVSKSTGGNFGLMLLASDVWDSKVFV